MALFVDYRIVCNAYVSLEYYVNSEILSRLNVNLHFIGFCSQCITEMLSCTVGA